MGCVVCGDGVHGAVRNALQQGLDVGLGSKRRIHLVVTVELHQFLVRQREVVGRHLAGDIQAPGLGLAHHAHRSLRAEVGQVQVASRVFR